MAEIQQIPTQLKPDHIIEIVFRQRWLIIIPICVTLTVGLYLTFTLPRTYSASTTILVQAQKVPGTYVRSIVSSDLSERISTISQQIMSQTNLEKIIDQFGLYEGAAAQRMYLEDKIKSLRKRINVKLSRARRGADAFTISFTGTEPDRVMRVANTLASFFMDENLKLREAQAIGTSEFLDSELEKTRKRLVQREKALSDYRAKYLGGLPDELETNLRTLDRLQSQLLLKQESLREAKNTMNVLSNQIAQSQEMALQSFDNQFAFDDFEDEEDVFESEASQKLSQLEKAYEGILLRYTKRHPDAIKVAKTIEKLKQIVDEEKASAETPSEEVDALSAQENQESPVNSMEGDVDSSSTNAENVETEDESAGFSMGGNWAVMQQEMQLNQMKNEIEKIKSDISRIQEQMLVYEQRVEDTPKREQELLSLKRDYGNIQDVYSSLLNRKLEAELSVNMEKKQKGEQFRILDHARLPERPISPDVKKLLIFSLAAGLACGGGLVFLLELLDGSVRRDDDIEEKMGLPIIAAIPPLKQAGDRAKSRFQMLLFFGMVLYAMLVLAAFMVVNQKGVAKVIEFIKSFI